MGSLHALLQSPNFCLDTVGGSVQAPLWAKHGKTEQYLFWIMHPTNLLGALSKRDKKSFLYHFYGTLKPWYKEQVHHTLLVYYTE